MTRITDEIRGLFKKVRTSCGGGVRSVELSDEQLCDLLDIPKDYRHIDDLLGLNDAAQNS